MAAKLYTHKSKQSLGRKRGVEAAGGGRRGGRHETLGTSLALLQKRGTLLSQSELSLVCEAIIQRLFSSYSNY